MKLYLFKKQNNWVFGTTPTSYCPAGIYRIDGTRIRTINGSSTSFDFDYSSFLKEDGTTYISQDEFFEQCSDFFSKKSTNTNNDYTELQTAIRNETHYREQADKDYMINTLMLKSIDYVELIGIHDIDGCNVFVNPNGYANFDYLLSKYFLNETLQCIVYPGEVLPLALKVIDETLDGDFSSFYGMLSYRLINPGERIICKIVLTDVQLLMYIQGGLRYLKSVMDNSFQPLVVGKGLSTNDYTNTDKLLVSTIANKQDKLRQLTSATGDGLWEIHERLHLVGSLQDAIISNQDLSIQNYSGYIFTNCKFFNCNFTNSLFSGAKLINCKFLNCNMTGVDWAGADVYHANFNGSTMSVTNAIYSTLYEVAFYNGLEVVWADGYLWTYKFTSSGIGSYINTSYAPTGTFILGTWTKGSFMGTATFIEEQKLTIS